MIMPSMPASESRWKPSTTCSGVPTSGWPAPAGDEALLELLDLLAERLALDADDAHEVAGARPVALVDDPLVVAPGLLLGVAADHEAVGHRYFEGADYVDATTLTDRARELADAHGRAFAEFTAAVRAAPAVRALRPLL